MNTTSLESVLRLLLEALRHAEARKESIAAFQRSVWQAKTSPIDPRISEVLADLAYDLDFYEPNDESRRQDPSFFGDERLEAEIRLARRKIKEAGVHVPEG